MPVLLTSTSAVPSSPCRRLVLGSSLPLAPRVANRVVVFCMMFTRTCSIWMRSAWTSHPLRGEVKMQGDPLSAPTLTRQPAGRVANPPHRGLPLCAARSEAMSHAGGARSRRRAALRLPARSSNDQQPARLALARPDLGDTGFHLVGDRGEWLVQLVREGRRRTRSMGGDPEHVRQLRPGCIPDLLLRHSLRSMMSRIVPTKLRLTCAVTYLLAGSVHREGVSPFL